MAEHPLREPDRTSKIVHQRVVRCKDVGPRYDPAIRLRESVNPVSWSQMSVQDGEAVSLQRKLTHAGEIFFKIKGASSGQEGWLKAKFLLEDSGGSTAHLSPGVPGEAPGKLRRGCRERARDKESGSRQSDTDTINMTSCEGSTNNLQAAPPEGAAAGAWEGSTSILQAAGAAAGAWQCTTCRDVLGMTTMVDPNRTICDMCNNPRVPQAPAPAASSICPTPSAGQTVHRPRRVKDTSVPKISNDDGSTWEECQTAGSPLVASVGFGAVRIFNDKSGGKAALRSAGFGFALPPFDPSHAAKYDHYLFRQPHGDNHYTYARDVVAPWLRQLARRGKGPVCLVAGSRGGQETIRYIWQHVWRGPTICVNASCGTKATGSFFGMEYSPETMPAGIPLTVTTCDKDEVGFKPELADRLLKIYHSRGEQELFVQYHSATDKHIPRSVPSILGKLVKATVTSGTAKQRALKTLKQTLPRTAQLGFAGNWM